MTLLLVLVLGFGAGVLVTLGLLRQRHDGATEAGPAAPEPSPPQEPPAPEESTEPADTLGSKLYRLSVPLETFGDSTAHPNQLAENAEFQQASALLMSADVPVDTVTQYALGANWTLACAAFDALRQRPDRDDPDVLVMNQIARLRPWPLHYALEYLLSLDARLPAGATVVGAESWWADNLMIPSLFRNYFTRLQALGDAPSFGTWLTMSTSSDPQHIEQFLKSLSHPFAYALIAELTAHQCALFDRPYLEPLLRF